MKKVFLSILGFILMISLFIVYIADRIISSPLIWIDIKPISMWFPRQTKFEHVRMEFPSLSHESLNQIIETRIKSRQYVKSSLIRVIAFVFILTIYKLLIWMI